jgi:hypothetical protein
LYVKLPLLPTPARTKPCVILETLDSLRESQIIEPIVPGMNRNLYENLSDKGLRYLARNVLTAMPERLSLHSDG